MVAALPSIKIALGLVQGIHLVFQSQVREMQRFSMAEKRMEGVSREVGELFWLFNLQCCSFPLFAALSPYVCFFSQECMHVCVRVCVCVTLISR